MRRFNKCFFFVKLRMLPNNPLSQKVLDLLWIYYYPMFWSKHTYFLRCWVCTSDASVKFQHEHAATKVREVLMGRPKSKTRISSRHENFCTICLGFSYTSVETITVSQTTHLYINLSWFFTGTHKVHTRSIG